MVCLGLDSEQHFDVNGCVDTRHTATGTRPKTRIFTRASHFSGATWVNLYMWLSVTCQEGLRTLVATHALGTVAVRKHKKTAFEH